MRTEVEIRRTIQKFMHRLRFLKFRVHCIRSLNTLFFIFSFFSPLEITFPSKGNLRPRTDRRDRNFGS